MSDDGKGNAGKNKLPQRMSAQDPFERMIKANYFENLDAFKNSTSHL